MPKGAAWAWVLFILGVVFILLALLLALLLAFQLTAGLAGPNASSLWEIFAVFGVVLVALGVYCQRQVRRA